MKMDKESAKTIDEYILLFPGETGEILQKVRKTIHEIAPDAEEMINYGIPTFTMMGNLVHFAAFKTHIGFYPTPSGIEKFKNELAVYKNAKGSVQFPLDQPMPYDLIRQITAFRVKENLAKAEAKAKKEK